MEETGCGWCRPVRNPPNHFLMIGWPTCLSNYVPTHVHYARAVIAHDRRLPQGKADKLLALKCSQNFPIG